MRREVDGDRGKKNSRRRRERYGVTHLYEICVIAHI